MLKKIIKIILALITEVSFTLALMVAGFIAYTFIWTDYKADQETEKAVNMFQEENPIENTTIISEDSHDVVHFDNIPTYDKPAVGEVFAVLHIPKWDGMEVPIAEGTTNDVLNKGYAGHYPATELIGEEGNFSVAAHRRTKGSSFREIDTLVNGDKVIIETSDAYLVYEMYDHKIVKPEDPDSLKAFNVIPWEDNSTPDGYYMTMTTCHPEYGNSERYIVNLKFVYWVSKEDGVPSILGGQ